MNKNTAKLLYSLLILPVPNLLKTADFYTNKAGFLAKEYLTVTNPHICLYRDSVEIILLQSNLEKIQPNRILHGYGYDGYFTGNDIKTIYQEFLSKQVKIVKNLMITDYNNLEFVFEGIDSRWICIGCKQR